MAKITDPDLIAQTTDIVFDTSAKTIEVLSTGAISATGASRDNGITFQCVYSFSKEEWRTDATLIKFPFPIISITAESFELVNGWDFKDDASRELIRDGGWALKDGSGTSLEEYMNVSSLGNFDAGTDQAYYQNVSGGATTDAVTAGEVNQPVKIYGDVTHGSIDYRSYFKLFLREQGKLYASYDLLTEQGLSALTYQKYALPLSNATDLKITTADIGIDANSDDTADVAPYTGMSITWYGTPQSRTIGASSYDFDIIIDGNNGTAEQIYEFVQWELRRLTDIDAGAGTETGNITDELLKFVGDTLVTLQTSAGEGVYIDNFLPADTNRIEFTDNLGATLTFPFVSAGNLLFNDNLQNDASAKYFVFFTNDDAGDNAGNDFDTTGAILIDDNSGTDISGDVSANASIAFDFDYDGNIQRGAASAGVDAPYTAVAIGLDTAQYVITTGNIVRSKSNSINYVASLERNYLNA